jgi:hypothetical protein
MKKMQVFYLVVVLALLAVSVVMFSGVAWADGTCEGFVGVPWGASKEQVQAAMANKGFPLIEHWTSDCDVYRGTFAGYPAELKFFFEKNVFYSGRAEFLDRTSTEPQQAGLVYEEIKRLFQAKYGLYNYELCTGTGCDKARAHDDYNRFCTWKDITSTATSHGTVEIGINRWASDTLDIKFYIRVTYRISKQWAPLKTDTEIVEETCEY